MVYDSRQDKHGQVDLTLQAAWLKHMEDVWPEAWTEILLDLKESLARHPAGDKTPHFIASLHLTCAADALASHGIDEKERMALLGIFQVYLEKKCAEDKAHQRTER